MLSQRNKDRQVIKISVKKIYHFRSFAVTTSSHLKNKKSCF